MANKILKTAIMMSIRKNYVDDIVAGQKHIEFRTRFPKDFKGVIAVYESGASGSHKVMLQFRTKGIVKYEPSEGITPELKKCFSMAGASKNELAALEGCEVAYYCIPILHPTFTIPRFLPDFSNTFQTEPKFERPPQSWQWFKYPKKE